MKWIAAAFLVILVSASAFRLPAPPPAGRLTHNVGSPEQEVIDVARKIQAQISELRQQRLSQAKASPAALDDTLKQLRPTFDDLLSQLSTADLQLTSEQVTQAETDLDALVNDLAALGHGHVDIEGGLLNVVGGIYNILKYLGADILIPEVSDVTTPNPDTKFLEELEKILFVVLPIIAPELGLNVREIFMVEKNFHSFVIHVEKMESGELSLIDGALYLTIDLLNIAEAFDVDVTVPANDTPTEFDAMLTRLGTLFGGLIEIIGRSEGVPEEKLEKIKADLFQIGYDFEAMEHGELSILNGIEAMLQDIIYYFQNFEDVPDSE